MTPSESTDVEFYVFPPNVIPGRDGHELVFTMWKSERSYLFVCACSKPQFLIEVACDAATMSRYESFDSYSRSILASVSSQFERHIAAIEPTV